MIESPFLLYIGRAVVEGDIKTSRGLAVFRPQECIGELRDESSPLTLGLPRMSVAQAAAAGARTLVLGVAIAGGALDAAMIDDAVAAIEAGLDVAAGLHSRLRDVPRLADAASRCGRRLHDIRDPASGIAVGTGRKRAGRRVLTVGTDCSVGKMYTALALARSLRGHGIVADFRATGQTGILVAGAGVPLDAVVADFISGAVEALSPARDDGGWDVIEGQGSLLHPSFAGVTIGLLHGAQPDALVLCHDPARPHMRGLPHRPMPDLADCLDAHLRAARLTNPGVAVAGISFNCSGLPRDVAMRAMAEASRTFGLPCVDPMLTGIAPITERILAWPDISLSPKSDLTFAGHSGSPVAHA